MSKKHWIYIKRGLSEDPKHRAAMGECVWLYMHIIDRADWETGIAFGWKDTEEAADMGMPVDTLRRQRQKLEELLYIRCDQKQHNQDVYILEWRNPREYEGEIRNPRVCMDDHPKISQGLNQGSNQGLNQAQAQDAVSTSTSKSKPLSNGGLSEKEKEQANAKVDAMIENAKKAKYPNREKIPEAYLDLCDTYVELTGQEPRKPVIMDWLQTLSEWHSAGIVPGHLRTAFDEAKKRNILIVRPGSLTNTAIAMKGLNKVIGTQNKSEVFRAEDHPEPHYSPPPDYVRERIKGLAKRLEAK